VYADIRAEASGCGLQITLGLSTTAIFEDLSGYFSGTCRDKASNIIWRYATPCRVAVDCKRNDLARMTFIGYFMSNSVFVPTVSDSGV